MNPHSRAAFRGAALRLLMAGAVLNPFLPVLAQEGEADAHQGLSRTMKLGIRFYEKRDDAQAMDRFLEVLMKGDPAERGMANEYINLMTHRMNTGDKMPMSPRSNPPVTAVRREASKPERAVKTAPPVETGRRVQAASADPDVLVEPMDDAQAEAPVEKPVETPVEPPKSLTKANRALMTKEIRSRIRNLRNESLEKIKSFEGVRVLKLENGDPQAIAIPTAALFQSQTSFKKTALPLLDSLISLAYSLSGAQVVILPEGTAMGDAKVPDMRRTMGLSSHLLSGDIAPSRVKVNLLNTQVDIPRSLTEFRGIIILFIYNQSLNLVVESSIGDEKGPPLSLGIHPRSFSAGKPEGSIIEFSVQDPPEGLVSWEFKLLQPTADGEEMAPLQEVVGGGPVYHQIYWNGHQGYFGPALAPGRYECVLTATDTKNRQRTLHRWIQLLPSSGVEPSELALSFKETDVDRNNAPSARAPTAELGLGVKKTDPLIRPAPAKTTPRSRARKSRGKKKSAAVESAPEESAAEQAPAAPAGKQIGGSENAPSESAPAGNEKPSAVPYELAFAKDKHELTPEADQTLSRLSETLSYYPLETVEIVGYAQSSEIGASALAQKRAQMVAGLLINKFKIEPKKIRVHSSVADGDPRVEIRFAGNE